jgi:predicted oxidoreductase
MPVHDADVLIVGAGLAGLVAAAEAADAGRTVLVVDQEGEQNLGAQAFWSFGGLFFVDSPEQRRLGIRDSRTLAERDWMATAAFDRPEDHWPRRWAEAYLDFAAGEKRAWLHAQGMRWFPAVGWAERGAAGASASGNSVPRFHVTWGTGPGVLEPFVRRVRAHEQAGRLRFRFRHRVRGLVVTDGVVHGVHGDVLAPTGVARGEASARDVVGDFALHRARGGGELRRESGGKPRPRAPPLAHRPAGRGAGLHAVGRAGTCDGLLQQAVHEAGAHLVNTDRMWHYTEGLRNWSPIWRATASASSRASSLWLDPDGRAAAVSAHPGADTLGTLQHITTHGCRTRGSCSTGRSSRRSSRSRAASRTRPHGKNVRLTLRRIGKACRRRCRRSWTRAPTSWCGPRCARSSTG